MVGDQNDKQRSCFWWFIEAGEWGSMTQSDSLAWRNTALHPPVGTPPSESGSEHC
jgi:hypothetical protein